MSHTKTKHPIKHPPLTRWATLQFERWKNAIESGDAEKADEAEFLLKRLGFEVRYIGKSPSTAEVAHA